MLYSGLSVQSLYLFSLTLHKVDILSAIYWKSVYIGREISFETPWPSKCCFDKLLMVFRLFWMKWRELHITINTCSFAYILARLSLTLWFWCCWICIRRDVLFSAHVWRFVPSAYGKGLLPANSEIPLFRMCSLGSLFILGILCSLDWIEGLAYLIWYFLCVYLVVH